VCFLRRNSTEKAHSLRIWRRGYEQIRCGAAIDAA